MNSRLTPGDGLLETLLRRIEYFNLHIARDMQISTKKGMTLMIDVWFDCRQDANNKDPD